MDHGELVVRGYGHRHMDHGELVVRGSGHRYMDHGELVEALAIGVWTKGNW